MSNIDLSKPVWCGGELREDITREVSMPDIKPFLASILQQECWRMDGTPLGDWPPLTNVPPVKDIDHRDDCRNVTGSDGGERPTTFTPPVKPGVDETEEEVKPEVVEMRLKGPMADALYTRIAALEECVRELRDRLFYVHETYDIAIDIDMADFLTRSKNLVP